MPLHVSSTMFSSSGGQKLYYTASAINTPVGGRPVLSQPVHRDGHLQSVMIPAGVYYNFDLLAMGTRCSKHVEARNKLIVKQIFCIKLVNY